MKKLWLMLIIMLSACGSSGGGSVATQNASTDSYELTNVLIPNDVNFLLTAKTSFKSIQSLRKNSNAYALYAVNNSGDITEIDFMTNNGMVKAYLSYITHIGNGFVFFKIKEAYSEGNKINLDNYAYVMNKKSGKIYTTEIFQNVSPEQINMEALKNKIFISIADNNEHVKYYELWLTTGACVDISPKDKIFKKIRMMTFKSSLLAETEEGEFMLLNSESDPILINNSISNLNLISPFRGANGDIYAIENTHKNMIINFSNRTDLYRLRINNNELVADYIFGTQINTNNAEKPSAQTSSLFECKPRDCSLNSRIKKHLYTDNYVIDINSELLTVNYRLWKYYLDKNDIFGEPIINNYGIAWVSSDQTSIFYIAFNKDYAETVVNGRNSIPEIDFLGKNIIFYDKMDLDKVHTFKYDFDTFSVTAISDKKLEIDEIIEFTYLF